MLDAVLADVGKIIFGYVVVIDIVKRREIHPRFSDIQHGRKISEIRHYRINGRRHGIGCGQLRLCVKFHYFFVFLAGFKHKRWTAHAARLHVHDKIDVIFDNLIITGFQLCAEHTRFLRIGKTKV